MAETEVESILREIRERVVAQQRAGSPASVMLHQGNGAGETLDSSAPDDSLTHNLALLNSYLTTTGRAWDRLPPVVSNRNGLTARIELWLKRHLKRATRWYSWEQVNFNAAVHHALRDLLPVLSAQQDEIARLRSHLVTASAAQQQQLEEVKARLSEAKAEGKTEAEALRAEVINQRHATETMKNQNDHKVTALENELRERIALLQEELRVCFKQLSLESSEAAVLEDRARRKTETLLEEIQRRMNKE